MVDDMTVVLLALFGCSVMVDDRCFLTGIVWLQCDCG